MKTKITLLTIGAALLLTACGQVQSSPTETTLPPTPAAREEARQPQATPEPATTAQEPDTVPVTTQEQPQKENTRQEESTPQTADAPEPVAEPTFSEDIPSETIHAKTGYVEPEPTPEPEPIPTPSIPADRQAAIDAANAYAVMQYPIRSRAIWYFSLGPTTPQASPMSAFMWGWTKRAIPCFCIAATRSSTQGSIQATGSSTFTPTADRRMIDGGGADA